jgi:hypothetical protein
MGCWNMGILEYWVLNASLHYSIIPLLQSVLRWSEAIERTLRHAQGNRLIGEAYEFFSAAC